jgi:large subunit ribosomal protein L10
VNRDEKAAVIDEVAERIGDSQAIFAVDYRGLSVKQAVELRQQLTEAGAHFQVVKNRLTIRAADKAGAEDLKAFLEGPTALTFVQGDAAVAAKAIATFRRTNGLLEWKGGTLDGEVLSVDQLESIAKLPSRDVLHGQFVGVLASPITGLVRGLASMIGGLASQLQQIADQGLVTGEAPAAEAAPAADEAPAAEAAPAADEAGSEESSGDDAPAEEAASGDDAPAEEPDAGDDAPAETATEEASASADEAAGEEASADDASDSGDKPDDKEPGAVAEASEAIKADAGGDGDEATPAEEAPGSPTAEAETAEQEEASGDAAQDETSESSEEPSEAQNQQEEG